jgi:hypothetical protein
MTGGDDARNVRDISSNHGRYAAERAVRAIANFNCEFFGIES